MASTKGSGFGWSQGIHPDQAHVHIPDGAYEEEHGRRGFYGRVSHLYHRHPPTGWLRIEGPLKPHAYRVTQLNPSREDIAQGQPEVFLKNADVKLGIAKLSANMKVFFRNADGDEVRFIHEGLGCLETDYGDLEFSTGDYLVIPRGVTYRFTVKSPTIQLVIESAGEIELPEKGMLGRHALFDPMMIRTPVLPEGERVNDPEGERVNGPEGERVNDSGAQKEYELQIKREGEYTRVYYPWNPLNAMGWKGDLIPWAINVSKICPVTSAGIHLPPSVHTTFVSTNFVICSFLPRPMESAPGALKVPFYHRNIDFDEVLFYHAGQFFSREGIGAGSVTWHPQGIHHGPHPQAAQNAALKTHTNEIAVMVDTRNPLKATSAAESVEIKDYAMSWKADQKR